MSTNHRMQVERLLSLAEHFGIELDSATVRLNDSGLDFLAVFAQSANGQPWVLRSPRRSDVIESAVYEQRVLGLVPQHLPVAVPNWQVHTSELIAYPLLGGVPAATINSETKSYDWYLDPENIPELFVQSLAEAMAALHGIDHAAALRAEIKVKQPSELRQSMSLKMEEIKAAFGVSERLWERWQSWLRDDSFWPAHTSMVHGDLHPGHILVDREGRVTGLLDWTEAEVGDPAVDFTCYYALFGDEGLSDLLRRYEQAGGRVWPRMREHIAELMSAYAVNIAAFALKSGLKEFETMARGMLGGMSKGTSST